MMKTKERQAEDEAINRDLPQNLRLISSYSSLLLLILFNRLLFNRMVKVGRSVRLYHLLPYTQPGISKERYGKDLQDGGGKQDGRI